MQIDKEEEKKNIIEGKREQQHVNNNNNNNNPASSSSPSHEFTFTISSSSTTKIPLEKNNKSSSTTNTTPPFIDLSPADEIFFHGHLLPLHLLSHLPISPRSSTNSLDSFTLPIKQSSQDFSTTTTSSNYDHHHQQTSSQESINLPQPKKPKVPFSSLFGLPRWRKITTPHQEDDENDSKRQRKKSRFDMMSNAMQRYMMRFIKLSFIRSRSSRSSGNNNNNSSTKTHIYRKSPFSFSSGNLRLRSNKGVSAPASIRTSPTNSGLLVASGSITPTTSSTSDSTMEELQAAIQAAIAHCKNSYIATQQDHIQFNSHN